MMDGTIDEPLTIYFDNCLRPAETPTGTCGEYETGIAGVIHREAPR
jgi:hypothetical protein